MHIEKGQNNLTMDDVNNLMDLYTQAVEFYNSAQQADRQKYYESKLLKLFEQPNVKKLYSSSNAKQDNGYENEEFGVKIYDKSITSPLQQLKPKKTMSEAMVESEVRKAKNGMAVTLHQKNMDHQKPVA